MPLSRRAGSVIVLETGVHLPMAKRLQFSCRAACDQHRAGRRHIANRFAVMRADTIRPLGVVATSRSTRCSRTRTNWRGPPGLRERLDPTRRSLALCDRCLHREPETPGAPSCRFHLTTSTYLPADLQDFP